MIKQLSIFLENKTGNLMQITKVLMENNINLQAVSTFESPEFGVLRVIVDQPELAMQVLEKKHFLVRAGNVMAVSVEDTPGGLHGLLEILANSNVGVNYVYSFMSEVQHAPIMIFHTEYMEEARQLLSHQGACILEKLEDL